LTHHRLVLEQTRRFERSCRPVQQDGEPRTRFMIKFGERGGRDKEFSRHRDLACVLMPSSRQANGVFQDSRGISVTPKVLSRRNDPLLLEVGFENVFFSVRPNALPLARSTMASSTTFSSSSRGVQRVCDEGRASRQISVCSTPMLSTSIGASEGRARGGEVSPPTSHCL
jgi:hypothetical protein